MKFVLNPVHLLRWLATSPPPRCCLHTSAALLKGNTRRLQVRSGAASGGASSKVTSRREMVAQMKADASRARWESEQAAAARLQGVRPPSNLNVYFASSFEPKRWPLAEAVASLREAAAPEMFNCLENPLYAKVILNCRTKKATKFISKLETSTTLPHQLDFLPKRRIIVLTNDTATAEQCVSELGAAAAGGLDIIDRLATGGFHWDEYDDVVAHPDFSESVLRVRKILQNRLPTAKNGRVGEDLVAMLKAQQICVLLNSTPVDGVPEINELRLVLGQLSWEDGRLQDNLCCYLEAVEKAKSNRVHGNAIDRIDLICPPIDEVFLLDATLLGLENAKEAKGDKVEEGAEEEEEEGEENYASS
uniref:50S ribosomal protein L1 n=1 Tax=Mesocestoides corti TaxID=53468 RepID=A0A5K3FIS0_MESCO